MALGVMMKLISPDAPPSVGAAVLTAMAAVEVIVVGVPLVVRSRVSTMTVSTPIHLVVVASAE